MDRSGPVAIARQNCMPISVDPQYSVAGFLVGLLVGQTGMGGGALMTPVLILLFGVHPATAVGIDLLYASVTKTIGTLVHGLSRTVKWRIVGLLASGSVPATALTLLLISRFDITGGTTSGVISNLLGAMLLLTALSLVFRRQFLAFAGNRLMAITPRTNYAVHCSDRRHAGRAGDDLLGRCRSHRRHHTAATLPTAADGNHRRVRHCARCAADPGCWRRPLVPRLGRLATADIAAHRFCAGRNHW